MSGVESRHGAPHLQPVIGQRQQQASVAQVRIGKEPSSQPGARISLRVGMEKREQGHEFESQVLTNYLKYAGF